MASPSSSPPPTRPISGILSNTNRSSSRMSMNSRQGAQSRLLDDDGKTSVKVAVRVRPPSRPTDPDFDLIPQRYQRSMVHTANSTGLTVESPQGKKFFIFDRVFGPETLQDGIWEYVRDSVDSFLQGFNVSVLAYGQSGSGKSYTMGTSAGGDQNNTLHMGVIPRAANALFQKLNGPNALPRASSGLRTPMRYSMHGAPVSQSSKASQDKTWHLKATYVEIYNEQLRDLLLPEETSAAERPQVSIREDTRGRILLTGLHTVNIESVEDLLRILNFGSSIRQTDSTAINAKSSRSHAIFSLHLVQKKERTQPAPVNKRFSMPAESLSSAEDSITLDNKLHFVDLAGSERLKNTGASGDRAKEGISINAGLASLGKVISQLSARHAGGHVSYRDSRLTRLLQDSLGGSAITYMIACVTPAEFHLSETLNTVQYAQRARAIQSKPQLQQVSDDSDKQATIDRLKAEVAFLRQQIRSSESTNNDTSVKTERTSHDREVELQNHLLDVQENYSALHQRHAKLISEITKSRDSGGHPSETPTLNEAIGESAVERLKRSNSFAEAVEQVVLEYEKTIQSLETSLTNTRSTLSSTESSLLEKENRCALVETLNQQLHARLQKLMDREASNEQYLANLEAKLEGQATGDEKSSAAANELRKEIARVRQTESQCEEYISTLEERLAEADQDLEAKQRELDRLEHVIERQRSLGKLDNLIYEYDHLYNDQTDTKARSLTNGLPTSGNGQTRHRRSSKLPTLDEAANTVIPDSDNDGDEDSHLTNGTTPSMKNPAATGSETPKVRSRSSHALPRGTDQDEESPAQKRAVRDKFETVTQELFDLKIQHESTVGEFDLLSAKYEEALRTLASIQEAPNTEGGQQHNASTSASFLEDARVSELKDRRSGQFPSSQSLSSDLSFAGDSNTSMKPSLTEDTCLSTSRHSSTRSQKQRESETSQYGASQAYYGDNGSPQPGLAQGPVESEQTRGNKDEVMTMLKHSYRELQDLHVETLDIVEELKTELAKSKMKEQQSPSSTSPVIRRKSSQNVMTIDRAHRSLASLKNIAADKFEHDSDTMQNFELNLNTAMHELHQRSERVQLLEGELAIVKKDMENKNSMLSGLARERSSIKATSPIMDISVLSQLNDQLVQREGQMRTLQDQHLQREQQLQREVEALKTSLQNSQQLSTHLPGAFPVTPSNVEESRELGNNDVVSLKAEVTQWQEKHDEAVAAMHASENQLLGTIAQLESSLTAVENMRNTDEHDSTMKSLQTELEEHKSMTALQTEKIAQLSQLHETSRSQAQEASRMQGETESSIEAYKAQIKSLETKLNEHQAAVDFHKHGLKSLHDAHARDLESLHDDLRNHEESKSEMQRSLQNMQDAHTGHLTRLESEVIDLKTQLEKSRGSMGAELERGRAQVAVLEGRNSDLQQLSDKLNTELAAITKKHSIRVDEMDKLKLEKDRAANLVEELEEQLSSSYDQQRANSARLSQLHNTHSSQLQAMGEANAAVAALEKQLESKEGMVKELQSQLRESQTSTPQPGPVPHHLDRLSTQSSHAVRKSASVTSLPSPPPVIPLPPLPAGVNLTSPTSASFPNSINGIANSINGINSLRPPTPSTQGTFTAELNSLQSTLSDRELHIKQMEKHLFAEKQLTATLEEALVDLETQGKKTKSDMEAYKKKCWALEDEIKEARREGTRVRDSVQAVEDERIKRMEAERAREKLEERMRMLDQGTPTKGKKKKSGFNCF